MSEQKLVYLHGGPDDGELVTVTGGNHWVSAADVPNGIGTRVFHYQPTGRRTLQGVEVFECAS